MGQNNKLDKNNIENFMSLTSLQQGMLFHYISDEESNMYHEQLSLTLRGDLKLELLQRAWQFVIDSNEMLRTIFRWKGIEKPIQVVLKQHEILINYLDFSSKEDKESLIKEIKLKDLNNKIDITRETLRIYLFKLDENNHEMIISNHHILYDGWSNGIILKELMEAYNCLYVNKESKRVNKPNFSEFVKYLNNINKKNEKKYWLNYLQNLEGKDDYFSCKEVGVHKEISYKINNIKASKIKDFSRENKILLSSILYGAWGILLQKFNNSKEVSFGTTVSGRSENIHYIDKMVGLFINTIPLRVKYDEKTELIELINSLDNSLNERKEFENTSLIDIKEYCGLKVNEELFNSIVTIENYPLDFSINKENVLFIEGFSIIEQTNYNMALNILTFDGIEFKFNFNSLSIDESIVEKMGIYLERIIENLLNNPNISIRNIDLLSEQEKGEILYKLNDTKVDYPKDKTIHELFEVQVKKTPDNIAVVFEDKKLTYRELNERANSLARVLRDKGVKGDYIIGIMIERSLEMIVAIMGILKAGGAYLPIDPKLPEERINYMISDSGINVLVTSRELTNMIKFDGTILDVTDGSLHEVSKENLDTINKSSDLAYIIYTSGTTGNPKGVMVEHNNVVRLIFNEKMLFKFSNKDVWTMFHSYCFDFSVWEMYGALLYGGKLVIVPELVTKDFEEYLELLKREKVTVLNQTPTAFYNLMNIELDKKEKDLKLKYIIFGGEALSPRMLYGWKQKYNEIKIINMYGITETTVHVTYKEIEIEEIEKGISNIGKPIPTLTTYVMNEDLKIQPIGISGELCVGGDGVARGYLNRNKLTEQKFVMNPYIKNERIYRSGDRVRLLENGDLEYLGRIDNQVKIRGFRIELGEIESKLLKHKDIKESAVTIKENTEKEKYICAYVISKKSIDDLNLKSYLKEKLPQYMIPEYFIQLDKMPLTDNGKLDKKALPEANLDAMLNEYEAPRNEIEETLAKIWSKILGVEKVGINDNFFDLGGHSLKATMLTSKIHKELNKQISLKELFKAPTIKALSQLIEYEEENFYTLIKKIEKKDFYEASSAQKSMYILQQFDKDSVLYNIPLVFEVDGNIDKYRIEESFKKLIVRHDALRTYFEMINGEIVQKIEEFCKFKIVQITDEEDIEVIIDKFVGPFDLRKAPLLRVELVESKGKTYLLMDIHHIISDGVSMNLLMRELVDIYNGVNLESLKIQYKDFTEWQEKRLRGNKLKKQKEYWLEKFRNGVSTLNFPTDYPRPVIKVYDGDIIKFNTNQEIQDKLKRLAKDTGTTMYMILLSAFYILLLNYSEQEEITVGTSISGRINPELYNVMGLFINTLAIKNNPSFGKKYIEFLLEVKESCIEAYENQEYPFSKLISDMKMNRDISRNPLFDVMFELINDESEKISFKGFKLKEYHWNNKTSKFDFSLTARETDKELSFILEYNTSMFDKETMEEIIKDYNRILGKITKDRNAKITDVCSSNFINKIRKKNILDLFDGL